ncbi:MAG: Smr protein/MutS2 [Novosphingobium sp.]|nr:Smr protein/MutS2 [Novosphingobium sp.]
MKPPRGLTPDEAALWARVAATVRPLRKSPVFQAAAEVAAPPTGPQPPPKFRKAPARPASVPIRAVEPTPKPRPLDRGGLDGSWDRKLGQGVVSPDFTLDLHGHTLDSAHARLDHGITQAALQGARVLLLITGKPRPADDYTERGSRRGAIRAKVLDWLAAGSHAGKIAAVRPAHPRHGGAGALYIVLKRGR